MLNRHTGEPIRFSQQVRNVNRDPNQIVATKYASCGLTVAQQIQAITADGYFVTPEKICTIH